MAFAPRQNKEPLNQEALYQYAVAALARKMRTVHDLKRLMKARAEEGEAGERAIDRVIFRLKELNYLSDIRFAADYTRLRKENEKHGRRRIQQDLIQKGVHRDLISKTLETAYEDVDEVALAREYIARKRIKQPSGENRQKETARVMGRLQRAGFSVSAVYKVLREWNVEVDETEMEEPIKDNSPEDWT